MATQVDGQEGTGAQPLTPEQQALVLGVLALVDSIVNQLCPNAPDERREELVAWGRDGATSAALRYNAAIGTRFSSFAYTHISGAILDSLRRDKRQQKLHHAASMAARTFVAETPDRFRVIWDGEATNRARLGTMAERLVASMAAGVAAVGLNPEESVGDAEDHQHATTLMRRAFAGMREEERALYRLRYVEGKKLEDIAADLGIAEITARRWHEAVLDKIAAALHARGITELPPLVETLEEDAR